MHVRDLMVNLAAARAAAADPQYFTGVFCRVCTGTCRDTDFCFFTLGCGLTHTPVEESLPTDGEAASRQLGALKAQLHQALAEIEKQESALQPQTVAEVEAHEKKLQGELAKLGQRKKDLAGK